MGGAGKGPLMGAHTRDIQWMGAGRGDGERRGKKNVNTDLNRVLTNNNSFLEKRGNLKNVCSFDFLRLTGLFLATQ